MTGKRLLTNIIKTWDHKDGETAIQKGTMLTQRNSCMLDRYVYYSVFKKKGYEETLRLLEQTFFITPNRIGKILMENADAIAKLKERRLSIGMLQSKWPNHKW